MGNVEDIRVGPVRIQDMGQDPYNYGSLHLDDFPGFFCSKGSAKSIPDFGDRLRQSTHQVLGPSYLKPTTKRSHWAH